MDLERQEAGAIGLPGRAGGMNRGQEGYAMAALLVMIAVMAVLMSVAMPVWRHEMRREREEELVFRGQQYVRAIRLYNARVRTFPPSVDVLVQGRYLRKKFKDPITDDDFQMLSAGQPVPGQAGAQRGQGGQVAQPSGQPGVGGMIGVASKSKDESIRVYQGRNHYNEWPFVFVQQAPVGPGGRGVPGRGGSPGPGRGGRGGDGRGGRGTGPAFPGGRGPGDAPPISFPGGRRGGGV